MTPPARPPTKIPSSEDDEEEKETEIEIFGPQNVGIVVGEVGVAVGKEH
jgi:hypothetical protein